VKIKKVIIHAADTLAKGGYRMIYAQHFSQEEFREWAEDMILAL